MFIDVCLIYRGDIMHASAMYVNYNLPKLDTVIRRNLFGFIQRLSISQNSIIRALEHSRRIKIKHWDCWTKILYL